LFELPTFGGWVTRYLRYRRLDKQQGLVESSLSYVKRL
jgi:hypothetical protein